jgi:dethiobiotin synthetase
MTVIVFAGTGTGVGKTHAASAFLRAAPRDLRCAGFKPFESGVPGGSLGAQGEDEAALFAASRGPFVAPIRLCAPLAPPLAADDEGILLSSSEAVQRFDRAREQNEHVVLELAGGLFSPFVWGMSNADWLSERIEALGRAAFCIFLVGPDRLGVLHDIAATIRAATATGLVMDAILLSPPAIPDASTGRNALALRKSETQYMANTPIYSLASASPETLASTGAMASLWATILPRSSSTDASQ